MKVKQLIKLLSKLPQNVEILLSSDDEGNSYRPLEKIDDSLEFGYIKTDSGYELYPIKLTEELEHSGFTQEEVNSKATRCIMFY